MSTSVLPDSERIDLTHTKAPVTSGPPGRKRKSHWLPYALVAPAILFELLIHIVPMLTGIWISFIQLTKYFIANWGRRRSPVCTTTRSSSTSTRPSARAS
ncbi:hypothetical protein P9139_18555 [Curtobacterium flaccumfaciens]|nr:hypothetical protein P9139_18555 [Curtobacterium flaccumfaciens]